MEPDDTSTGVPYGVMDMRAVQILLAAMPDPAAEVEHWRRLTRESSRDAYRLGWKVGYEHGARLLVAEWPAIVAPIASGSPSHAELELLRWGPGGREHFGDPRPTDRLRPHQRGEDAA